MKNFSKKRLWIFGALIALSFGFVGLTPPSSASAQTFGSSKCGDNPNCTQASNPFNTGQRRGAACDLRGEERTFLGFPTWYHYLDGERIEAPNNLGGCRPYLHSARDVWLIGAAVFEILLRLSGIAAVIFVIWGGYQYIFSQGQPDRVSNAKSILANAITGLILVIFTTRIVGFIASRFSGATDTNLLLPSVEITKGTLNTGLNIAFQIAGGLAVIFVIWGGLTYARSNGDPAAIKQAKEMIIYALVGLVVVIFAQAIIKFAVERLA